MKQKHIEGIGAMVAVDDISEVICARVKHLETEIQYLLNSNRTKLVLGVLQIMGNDYAEAFVTAYRKEIEFLKNI